MRRGFQWRHQWWTVRLSFVLRARATARAAYPTQLDTARVQLQYAGKTAYTQVYYVSPSQINFLAPADTPIGTATLEVTPQTVNADGSWTSGNTLTSDVAAFSAGIYAITDESGRVISETKFTSN